MSRSTLYSFLLIFNVEKLRFVFLISSVFIVFAGCSNKDEVKESNTNIAASVYEKKLFRSDIVLDLQNDLPVKEKLELENSYIEHWVRKTLLTYNASKDIGDFSKIDRLVEDYKNSLIVEAFKYQYVRENMDSVISDEELKGFYSENINNYILDYSVINLFYAKISDKSYNLDKFYENWKKNKYQYISDYGVKNSEDYYLDKDRWYNLKEMKNKIPKFLLKNKDKYEVQINKKNYEYFLKVFDTKHKNENIPLDMVKDDIKKLILQKRKSDILDKYIEELYKKEIANDKIKIYN